MHLERKNIVSNKIISGWSEDVNLLVDVFNVDYFALIHEKVIQAVKEENCLARKRHSPDHFGGIDGAHTFTAALSFWYCGRGLGLLLCRCSSFRQRR